MVIIAAVDRSQHGQRVVAEAASLADAFDDDLHVSHVLTQAEFIELEQTSYEDTGKIQDMSVVRDTAESIAAEAAKNVSRSYETVGLVGNPNQRIVEYAREVDTRYIVVGPRKKSPTGKVVFGSTAQSILLNSDHPVVSVVESRS